MKNKLLKGLVSSLALVVCGFANASLIEADYATGNDNLAVFDDSTGLTWLDASLTVGMTFDEALIQYEGFRLATNTEVEQMYSSFFSEFNVNIDNINNGNYSLSTAQTNQLLNWTSLFGESPDLNWNPSYLRYLDEDNIGRLVGNRYVSNSSWYFAGLENTETWNNPGNYMGVAMVRVTDVPEPSTLAMFALGLMGLASRKFKKQA